MSFRNIIKLSLVVSLMLIGCSTGNAGENETIIKNGIKTIINKKPKYESDEFLTLEKLYSINTYSDDNADLEYGIDKVDDDMDVDSDNNLYVLGNHECAVFVFDEKGRFIKKLGGN